MTGIKVYKQVKAVSPDTWEKLDLSREEIKDLTRRDILCPFCGYLVDRVYSDISGHKDMYCKKCKEKYTVNLGYFRTQKYVPYFEVCFADKVRPNR